MAGNVQRMGEVVEFEKPQLHFLAAVDCCFVNER